jgi:predicted DNA-binding protein (MmcQ/YjbR family)
MNSEYFRDYCLSKPMVTEEFPFDEDVLVFKVGGKIFALCSLSAHPPACNLKCKPAYAIELRERYAAVTPGYHMNKKHWNTVEWHGDVSPILLRQLIDHSYDLVVAGLPARQRVAIKKG